MPLTKDAAYSLMQIGRRPRGKASSVRLDPNAYRIRIAREQALKEPMPIEKITCYVNEFLTALNMLVIKDSRISLKPNSSDAQIHEFIERNLYQPLHDKYGNCSNLVWMKFTQDGYLGVVAVSNDINFDIPASLDGDLCTRNTSGIIVKSLDKQWDRSFVLAFPLVNIPKGLKRGDIESGIGNYLISKETAILDFYSHRY